MAGNHTHRTKKYRKGFFNSTSSMRISTNKEDPHAEFTAPLLPTFIHHHAPDTVPNTELIHSSQQSYKVDTVITSSSKDEETEAQRSLKSCLRSSSEDVAKTGYSLESLAPGLSSEPVCYCYDPRLSRGPEGTAEYRSRPYLITLSWALMFSCDFFMRRSGN